MTKAEASLPSNQAEIEGERTRMGQHPFLLSFRDGTFSLGFARQVAAMQVGYNLNVIVGLTQMRRGLVDHPAFICEFLDPLLATEFGADLDAVGLEQQGTTHIKTIFDLVRSLDMSAEDCRAWGEAASRFFDEALLGLLGGDSPAAAMGALFANEVFATAWYPVYHEGFRRFSLKHGIPVDLVFLKSHGSEIELAHVEHVFQLLAYREAFQYELDAFADGYLRFSAALERKFASLHARLVDDIEGQRRHRPPV